jgi:superfamily I DNA/RNA helicase
VEYLANRVQQIHERGTPWNEIAIVYRVRWMAERICKHFQQTQIPVEWVNRDNHSRDYRPAAASIKLVTMHSSKGLEFPVVFIPGIGFMPSQNSSERDEARLLYIAMTRAIHQLVITGDRSSLFVRRLERAIATLPNLDHSVLPATNNRVSV